MTAAADDDVVVEGCRFPRNLLYDVPNHLWYQPLHDGRVRVGMTVVAVALASNRIFAFTPKRVGRDVEKGRSCATIESSKWVGPARIAFNGVVEEINQDLIDDPSRLVSSPYADGWMLVARPALAVADALSGLVTGDGIAPAYTAWMQANNFPGCGPATP